MNILRMNILTNTTKTLAAGMVAVILGVGAIQAKEMPLDNAIVTQKQKTSISKSDIRFMLKRLSTLSDSGLAGNYDRYEPMIKNFAPFLVINYGGVLDDALVQQVYENCHKYERYRYKVSILLSYCKAREELVKNPNLARSIQCLQLEQLMRQQGEDNFVAAELREQRAVQRGKK